MKHEPFSRYGAIVGEDVAVLESCLALAFRTDAVHAGKKTLRVLEIGMHDGGTAKGIGEWCRAHGVSLIYVGIDPDDGKTRPRHVPLGGLAIVGDSAEVFGQVDGEFDLVWIDGCHCFNHVALDTLHYAPKVRSGGFLCYHDANPAGQGKFHQYHGPDTPEFGLGITAALKALRFPWEGWEFHTLMWPDDREDCGTLAFRRTK